MSQTTTYYHPRIRHSSAYYFSVLTTLIKCLQSGITDRETAKNLNESALLSPTGKPWTASSVKAALFKLRNYRDIPNGLHRALMELCFEGKLVASECLILFESRKPGM